MDLSPFNNDVPTLLCLLFHGSGNLLGLGAKRSGLVTRGTFFHSSIVVNSDYHLGINFLPHTPEIVIDIHGRCFMPLFVHENILYRRVML